MAIHIDQKNRIFTLHTLRTTYQMKVEDTGILLHTYYGARTDDCDLSQLICPIGRGFSGNPYEADCTDRDYSTDLQPQEYSCFGTGDYRITALRVRNADGSRAADLRYQGYEVRPGKYALEGLPAVHAGEQEAETLVLRLRDPYTGMEAELLFGVLPELDVITRAVKITNGGQTPVVLEKAASISIDWQYGDFDWITFHGRHAMERNFQRTGIAHGVQSVGSVRGASSHHYNPFVMLCDKNAGEEQGNCYGFSFVYSGEFLMEAEKDQMDQTRLICGIHPDNFAWKLEPGESFTAPEVLMAYSGQGQGGVSRIFHRLIRDHICRGQWKHSRRTREAAECKDSIFS